jgi:hypothetical protein
MSLAGCSVYDPNLAKLGDSQLASGSSTSGTGGGPHAGTGGSYSNCTSESGPCSRPYAEATCVKGQCTIVACEGAYADCDEVADNGCEARLDSVEHCGLCKAACRFNHGTPACGEGGCTLGGCEDGWGDCDGDSGNGCERAVNTARDCGQCGTSCDNPPHATAGCIEGACGVGQCDPGWGDCNGAAADGCERKLDDADHCGTCDNHCQLAHTTLAGCVNGTCAVTKCADGWDDCNGRAGDGCEVDLHSAEHCGACGKACVLAHVQREQCGQGDSCAIDHGCGEGRDCPSATEQRGCADNFADCDHKPENGCETDLTRLSDCGACGHSCVAAGTISECRNGGCNITGCADGYQRCGDQCHDVRNDPKNCGACGNVCPSSTPTCAGGVCTGATCDATHADCNKNNRNCDFDLTQAANCGACEHRCPDLPHATAACKAGNCAVGACADGWADCDGDPSNGCEVAVTTANDCGACKKACAGAHGSQRCSQGQCQVDKCDSGFDNCNASAADGCETDLAAPASCGSCGTSCVNLPNAASSSCGGMGCEITCASGRANCNGMTADGCEASLSDANNCGSCGTNCNRLANVTSGLCTDGSCRGLTCRAGFGDCDGNAANGCEASLTTTDHCGACDQSCALAHATADCSSGGCALAVCDAGFADCDGNAANGCEASLASPEHCGTCGNVCSDGATCNNGSCSNAAAACSDDSGCTAPLKCCDGHCTDTNGVCFPWPCIPGTDMNTHRNNCGACDALCVGWCCLQLN